MSNNVSTSVSSNNITAVFAGFLGAFIVGSLGVQLVRTQKLLGSYKLDSKRTNNKCSKKTCKYSSNIVTTY